MGKRVQIPLTPHQLDILSCLAKKYELVQIAENGFSNGVPEITYSAHLYPPHPSTFGMWNTTAVLQTTIAALLRLQVIERGRQFTGKGQQGDLQWDNWHYTYHLTQTGHDAVLAAAKDRDHNTSIGKSALSRDTGNSLQNSTEVAIQPSGLEQSNGPH